jgi:hypothetical protein
MTKPKFAKWLLTVLWKKEISEIKIYSVPENTLV